MLLQMQGFFKDMNAICKVLNIGQPVLQTMTVLCFVSREKCHEGSVISAKVIVKYCNLIVFQLSFLHEVSLCGHATLL